MTTPGRINELEEKVNTLEKALDAVCKQSSYRECPSDDNCPFGRTECTGVKDVSACWREWAMLKASDK